MDSLRRVRFLPLTPRARRSRPAAAQSPFRGLRGRDRALAQALDQLHAGIPLNWTQVEDDPELVVLSALQPLAAEVRDRESPLPPAELRADLFERLVPGLPKPPPEPAKPEPKPLAGFSENVPVITEPEEDIPTLTVSMPQWIGAVIVAGFVLVVVVWLVGQVSEVINPPLSFRWITVRDSDRVISHTQAPSGWTMPNCAAYSITDPDAKRSFQQLADKNDAQLRTSVPIQFFPQSMPPPLTYTSRLMSIALAPCISSTPQPSDPGTVVKLSYLARHDKGGGFVDLAPVSVFEARQVPIYMNVTSGTWKEVRQGDFHGIFWTGGPYTDIEGNSWIGNVSVLAVERGDFVMMLVSQPDQGVSEQMLLGILAQIDQEQASNQAVPAFTWIEMRKGDEVFSRPHTSSGASPISCTTPTPRDPLTGPLFTQVSSLDRAEAYTGFPVLSLPVSATTVPSLTFKATSVSVRACTANEPQPKDPGATVRTHYQAYSIINKTAQVTEIDMYQSRRQLTPIDVLIGSWREVNVSGAHGVFWTGGRYHDMAGFDWTTDANVLVLEKNDYVVTLVTNGLSSFGQEQLTQMAGLVSGW